MPAWIWFVVAALAAAGGALLLLSERSRSSAPARDRRRWAEQKSWEFVEIDPVLPSRWRYGAVHQGGHGRALDLATGAVPGPGGRRLAHVFDHEQGGQVSSIVAAVRGVAPVPVALELRLPSAPLPDDAGLDSLGQVGDRYAFVTDVVDGRPLITAELTRAADGVGDDVPLLWAEDTWVLATIDTDADTGRVQELLQSLVDVSVALEEAVSGPGDAGHDEEWFERFAEGDDDGGHDGRPDRDGHDDARDDAHDDARDDDGHDDGAVDRGHDDRDGYADERSTDDHAVEREDAGGERGRAGAEREGGRGTTGGPAPTHRDRPGDIPYDIENDESGSSGRPRGASSLFRGATRGR